MAHVRRRRDELLIVQQSQGLQRFQRVLFRIYSKAEAKEAIGEGRKDGEHRFRSLLEYQYPGIAFNWEKISRGIRANLSVLPDHCSHEIMRQSGFRSALRAFVRELLLLDPEALEASTELSRVNRYELEYLLELIQWRLRPQRRLKSLWNGNDPFFWRSELRGPPVPPSARKLAVDYYERGDLPRASAVFALLTQCFGDYAEGLHYLGRIAKREGEEFLGDMFLRGARRLGEDRLKSRKRFLLNDLSTYPYIKGAFDLLVLLGREYKDGDPPRSVFDNSFADLFAAKVKRVASRLNLKQWKQAADAALCVNEYFPEASFMAAFGLYQLGRAKEALVWFLHGALGWPKAARVLAGFAPAVPRSGDDVEDLEMGAQLLTDLDGYLRRHRSARRFLRRILGTKAVKAILEEVEDVSRHVSRRSGLEDSESSRKARKRMKEMWTISFARERAQELLPVLLRQNGAEARERMAAPAREEGPAESKAEAKAKAEPELQSRSA